MTRSRTATTSLRAWALAAVALIAAALRLREAWGTPLWFDEIYLAEVARLPAGRIVDLAARDIHPPLAFLLFGAWHAIAGDSDLVLKLLPIALGLLTVVVTWRLGSEAFGPGTGLLAALLLALSPAHVRYSQEVEVYALLALFPVLLAWLAWRWVETRRGPYAVGLAATAIAALYTHYLLVFAVLASAVWTLLALRRDPAMRRGWLLVHAAIVAAFVPQLPILAAQFRREGSAAFFHWPGGHELVHLAEVAAPGGAHAAAAGLLIGAVALVSARTRRAVALIVLMAVLPLAACRLLPVVIPRDFLHLAPLGALLVAAGVTALPSRPLRRALAVVLIALAARDLARARPFEEPRALAQAASFIRQQAGPSDWIVHAETHALLFGTRYLPGFRHRILVPAGGAVPFFEGGLVVPDTEALEPAAWDSLRTRRTWWGLRVDRAYVTRGVASRAGVAGARALDAAAGGVLRHFGPVSVWAEPALRRAVRDRATR